LTLELTKKYPVIAFESNIDRTTSAKERLKIVEQLQSDKLQELQHPETNNSHTCGRVDLSKIVHVSEFLTTANAERVFAESTRQMTGLETDDVATEKKVTYLLTGTLD
jgi:hypothetical protein